MTPSRYPSIAWPWVGVLLCAALLGQEYLLQVTGPNAPLTETIRKVFEGSGECAEKAWVFLHLSVAGWALVIFIAMIVASFALIRRD